ncbi:MAG: cyclic nucleotide-binding domain-containing protein [Verrucomicrobiota bacterium]
MEAQDGKSGYRIWAVDDVVYGPVELPILTSWIRDERVTAQTWIFVGQSGSWHKAADVPELQTLFGSKEPNSEVASGSPGPATPLVPGIKPGMLRRVKILADMTDQQLGRFIQFMEVQKIRQWTEFVKQGSAGDAMYLVLEGEVRVRMMIGEKETILATLPAGEFFGDLSLIDHAPRSADVVANQDSVLLKISVSAFQSLLQMAPEISTPFLLAICKTLAARIRADDKRYRDSINFARTANFKSSTA